MSIDDAINRDLSWASAVHAWVKAGIGDAAGAVTIDADGYRRQVRVTRDRDGAVLWLEDESGEDEGGQDSVYVVACDGDGERVIEGDPERFWAKLRGWARTES